MALRQTKKISELPALSPASLDTTFVVGISGSTTYKISINQLTSSLDTTFATDLVTATLSGSLDAKLTTSSFNSYTASISTASLVTSISNLNTFTASQSTSSLVNRLNAIESVSGSWITESETGSFLTSLSGAISSSSQLTTLGFATTGSNSFSGSQTISTGSITILGRRFADQPKLTISASDDTLRTIVGLNTLQVYSVRDSASVGINNSFSANISAKVDNQPSASVYFTLATLNTGSLTTGVELKVQINSGSGIVFNDYNTSISSSVPFMHIAPNNGNNPNVEFSRSVDISGSLTSNGFGVVSGSSQISFTELNNLPAGIISGSAQLTSSFDTRYAISASFVSSSNLSSIRTITSASYAALTPVSGTLYIIIG